MSSNDFDLLKIETYVFKVHINCYGCEQKVKKLLRRIEGVYKVNIDAEQHKVTVAASVDYATLIKKLGKSGKHAELWSPSTNQNPNQNQNQNQNPNQNQDHQAYYCIKDDRVQDQMQCQINGLKASKSHPILAPTCLGEVEDEWGYERYLRQNMGMEAIAGENDQNIMATAKMDNVHLGGNAYTISGDDNMENNMKCMMGFEGFQHKGAGFEGNEFGGPQNFYAGLPPFEYYHHPSYMQGYQYNHLSPMMMMMKNIDMQDMNMNMMVCDNMYMDQPQHVQDGTVY